MNSTSRMYSEMARWHGLLFAPPVDLSLRLTCRLESTALVLGSAPDPLCPANLDDTWSLVCVNASQSSAVAWGLDEPDLLVLRRGLFWTRQMDDEARAAISGRAAQNVVFQYADEPVAVLSRELAALPFRAEKVNNIQRWLRDRVLMKAVGSRTGFLRIRNGVSSGVFAVALASQLGAQKIVLSGFSLRKDGHAYSSSNIKRKHTDADRLALQLMHRNRIQILSTDPDLAAEVGIPKVEATTC